MKAIFILLLILPCVIYGQQDSTAAPVELGDTTVYSFADEAPRFPSPCERYDTTAAAKSGCAQQYLLDYVYQRVIYPPEAREQGISGTAVVSFIVERNGLINRPEVLRDPGAGIGNAALNSVISMAREVLWRPALRDGEPVRFRFVLPIRFRIEEPKPYVVLAGDTIYTDLTQGITFTGGDGSVTNYFDENLTYPDIDQDSCATGQLDIQLIIRPNGLVEVNDIIDYNDLGLDFTSRAIDVATGSYGKWKAAEYQGRKVSSAYDVSVTFAPTDPGCAYRVEEYNQAVQLMEEGRQLATDSLTLDEGLSKMGEAIELFPRDGRFRILRGQARMDNNLLSGACEDLSLAKQIAIIDWYDSVLPLICRQSEPEVGEGEEN